LKETLLGYTIVKKAVLIQKVLIILFASIQFHGDQFSIDALFEQMSCYIGTDKCCTAITLPTVTTCSKTVGPIGESVLNFPSHQALTAGHTVFFGLTPYV
jgi:hypothetical protein